MNRGKFIVVLMLAVALIAAALAIAHQYRSTRRPLNFWGAENARLIDTATTVELANVTYQNGGTTGWSVGLDQIRDISDARGLIHFRRSLVEDSSFLWDASPNDVDVESVVWQHALLFDADTGQALVLLDLKHELIGMQSTARVVKLAPHVAAGMRKYIDEQKSE